MLQKSYVRSLKTSGNFTLGPMPRQGSFYMPPSLCLLGVSQTAAKVSAPPLNWVLELRPGIHLPVNSWLWVSCWQKDKSFDNYRALKSNCILLNKSPFQFCYSWKGLLLYSSIFSKGGGFVREWDHVCVKCYRFWPADFQRLGREALARFGLQHFSTSDWDQGFDYSSSQQAFEKQ